MANNDSSLDDERWLKILNGSVDADPESDEQRQLERIRALMLKEQQQYDEAERQRLRTVLKQQGLFAPATADRHFLLAGLANVRLWLNERKALASFAVLASLVGVVVLPLLQQPSGTTSLVESPSLNLSEGVTIKSIEAFPSMRKVVKSAHQQALAVQSDFVAAGLKVSLEQQQEGWLLTTKLPVPLSQYPAVLAVIDRYSLALPMGASPLQILFIEQP